MLNFFVDKKPLFKKLDTNKINKISVLQLLQKRYGINNTIAAQITKIFGAHKSLQITKYKYNLNIKNFKNIYIKKNNKIDTLLKKKQKQNLLARCNNSSYSGNRYLLKLPMYGQRRRSNANTCKKVRPL